MSSPTRPALARTSHARPAFHNFLGRRLFALEIVPVGTVHGALLYLPPFAEEMNRCRSHVAAQARVLAAAGWHCMLLDPYGTGESDGETTDGHWEHWRDDALAALRWLGRSTGHAPVLWGVRTGALLAAHVADQALADGGLAPAGQLWWQPVLDGKVFLNQYLRLRLASQLVKEGERETTDSIRARLHAGEAVEVAGYALSGTLADGLAAASVRDAAALARLPLAWLEVVAKPEQPFPPAARKLADAVAAAGGRIETASVADPMIWQLQKRDDTIRIGPATTALLQRLAAPATTAEEAT